MKPNKIIGGVMLVAGTQTGAGMLALPITTGASGFIGSMALFLLCFLYMLISLFLLLETNYYSASKRTNIISMAKSHIGSWGATIAAISFALLMYSALSAYISGCNEIIVNTLNHYNLGFINQNKITPTILALIFSMIIYFGSNIIDYANRILMIALVVSYLFMLIILLPQTSYANLSTHHFKYLTAALPVVILSFTSHIILPSLREFLDDDIAQLKIVLIWGSIIPLIIYLLWNLTVIGMIPFEGKINIISIARDAKPIVALSNAMGAQADSSLITDNNHIFSFCAITTSIIGVLLGLRDFIADGLKVEKNKWNNIPLLFACVAPPLALIYIWPSIFILALSYGGVLIAILYGILPPIMAWKARYNKNITSRYTLPGGKSSLILVALGAIIIIFAQIALIEGLLSSP
jgi:tyrosine-specific transport protein